MGCGKSSIGRRLSELLCCSFIDLDDIIEANAGKRIPVIFKNDGEAAFRKMELEELRNITHNIKETVVLSLGGGTITTEECAEIIRRNTFCIYLRASVNTLTHNLKGESGSRPMLKSALIGTSADSEEKRLETRIKELMAARGSIYEETAHIIIDTDGKTIDECASAISQYMKDNNRLFSSAGRL